MASEISNLFQIDICLLCIFIVLANMLLITEPFAIFCSFNCRMEVFSNWNAGKFVSVIHMYLHVINAINLFTIYCFTVATIK